MKTILDVIIACKDQTPVSEEDLRLTVVSLSAMLTMVERDQQSLAEAVIAGKPSAKMRAEFVKREAEIRFKSCKLAPRDYLGPESTPGTPENKKFNKMCRAIFKKATGDEL